MKETVLKVILILLLFIQLISLFNGCTVFFGGIVAIGNAVTPDWTSIKMEEMNELKVGTVLLISLKNGNQLNGKYCGFEIQTATENDSVTAKIQKAEKIFIESKSKKITVNIVDIEHVNIKTPKGSIIAAMIPGLIFDGAVIYHLSKGDLNPIGDFGGDD